MKLKQPIQASSMARCFGLLLGCCLLAINGCESDTGQSMQPSPVPDGMTRVTLQIAADGTNATDNPEDCIHTLRVYAFQEYQNEMKLLGYAYRQSADENTSLNLGDGSADAIAFTLPNAMTTFVAIANEDVVMEKTADGTEILRLDGTEEFPRSTLGATTNTDGQPSVTWSTDKNGALLPEIITLGQNLPLPTLQSLTFSQLPQSTVDTGTQTEVLSRLPMGILTEASTNTTRVYLRLKRSVAKVNFYFAKVGTDTDKLYMGRGMYLYNQPPYGYLVPKTSNDELTFNNTPFHYVETDEATEEDYDKVDQRNGFTILKAAGPNLPSEGHPDGIDINEVSKVFSPPSEGEGSLNPDKHYQRIPEQTFYLFANPFKAEVTNHQKPVTTNGQGGYYVKILAHAHITGVEGTETSYNTAHFYVSLKDISPNQHIRLCSAISLNGYLMLTPQWKITEWNQHDMDIEFD